MEGELRTTRKKFATFGERAEIVKYHDNLQPEGQFELPEAQAWANGERSAVVKRADNSQLQGEFQSTTQ